MTLDLLGESVASTEAAADGHARLRSTLIQAIDARPASGATSRSSSRSSASAIDRATSVDNLRRMLDAGGARRVLRPHRHGELAATPTRRSTSFETMWGIGYRNVGVVHPVVPAASAEADVARMIALGVRVRLVKGAYREPRASRSS